MLFHINGIHGSTALPDEFEYRRNLFSGHAHTFPCICVKEEGGPLYVNTGSVAYCFPEGETIDTQSGTYGSYGWLVSVHESCIEFRLRDFLAHSWVEDSTCVHPLV